MTDGGLAAVNQKLQGTTGGIPATSARLRAYTNDQYSEAPGDLHAAQRQPVGRSRSQGQVWWSRHVCRYLLRGTMAARSSCCSCGIMATGPARRRQTDPLAAGTTLTLTAVGSTLAFAVNNTSLSRPATTPSPVVPRRAGQWHGQATNWSGGNSGFQVEYQGAASGIQTYDFVSPEDGYGTQTLRVLQPTHPAAGVAHNFLFVLPVEAGLGQ